MKSNYLIVVVLVILVGAGGFFAGMKYQEGKTPSFTRQFSQNGTAQRGQFGQRPGGAGGFQPVSGTVISKDDSSFTVSLPDGSSKIILLSDSSVINKTEQATKDDIVDGLELMVLGQQNPDGSITAQNIQIGSNFGVRFNQPTGEQQQ